MENFNNVISVSNYRGILVFQIYKKIRHLSENTFDMSKLLEGEKSIKQKLSSKDGKLITYGSVDKDVKVTSCGL